jgi:hypothetical protein
VSDYKTKSVAVVDNGIFSELASTLAKSFGKTYYNSPWVSDLPSSHKTELGEGFPDFERVPEIWGIIDDVDLFVFPDIYQGPLQEYLVSIGKRVFGARSGDELENFRGEAKAHFADLGLPQAPYEIVKGTDALRKYLKSRGSDKVWVKIDLTRGDTETFPSVGYDLVKNKIDQLEADLGPVAKDKEFLIEDNLKDTLDIAIDTYCIDGKFPTKAVIGCEIKGEAYLGAVKKWSEIPSQLTDIYETVGPTLEKYEYRCMLSLESRIMEKKIWLCDPCCRAGSPPFELQLNWLKNLPEIMWEGADGKLVEPEYDGKYGFELIVHSDWAQKHPLRLEFPEKYADKLKFRYASQFPDGLWIMPQDGGPRIAAAVTHGDDYEACFEEAIEIVGSLNGIQVETFTRAVPELRENLKKLASWGYNFK